MSFCLWGQGTKLSPETSPLGTRDNFVPQTTNNFVPRFVPWPGGQICNPAMRYETITLDFTKFKSLASGVILKNVNLDRFSLSR
jgi:hypothetical protein